MHTVKSMKVGFSYRVINTSFITKEERGRDRFTVTRQSIDSVSTGTLLSNNSYIIFYDTKSLDTISCYLLDTLVSSIHIIASIDYVIVAAQLQSLSGA